MTPLVYHPIYSQLTLPSKHRFPIGKYTGIYNRLRSLGVSDNQFYTPAPVTKALLTHYFDPTYVSQLLLGELDKQSMRRIGFPWSPQLIQRTLTAVGGTLLTAQLALEQGIALNLTGGYHHAFYAAGSGFCLFNDLYLAANQVLTQPGIDSVLIIDLDVHQGDGTAFLAQGNPGIHTLSLHGEKNFPYRKQHSDFDFALPSGIGDKQYLAVLDDALCLVERSLRPDFILYDAGVDIHQRDDLGLLSVTDAGILERDRRVLAYAQSQDIPVACVIGGGYQRDLDALVDAHINLFRAAQVIA